MSDIALGMFVERLSLTLDNFVIFRFFIILTFLSWVIDHADFKYNSRDARKMQTHARCGSNALRPRRVKFKPAVFDEISVVS